MFLHLCVILFTEGRGVVLRDSLPKTETPPTQTEAPRQSSPRQRPTLPWTETYTRPGQRPPRQRPLPRQRPGMHSCADFVKETNKDNLSKATV